MESATNGRSAPGGQGGRSRASRLAVGKATAARLCALRQGSAEIARLVRFGVGALWRASPLLALALILLGGTNGLAPLLQVWATTHLVDSMTSVGPSTVMSPPDVGTPLLTTLGPFLPWLGALIGAMVLMNLVDAATPLLCAHLNERVGQTLEHHLYEKALTLGLAAFESPGYYDRLERARQFLGREAPRALDTTRYFLTTLVGIVATAGVLARVSWPLTLMLLAGSVPVALIAVRQTREFLQVNYRQSPLKRRLAYWRDLSTRREPAAELRLFGLGDHLRERWRRLHDQAMQELFDSRRRFTLNQLLLLCGSHTLNGVLIVGIIAAAARGAITAGALVATLYALRQFVYYRESLGYQIEAFGRYGAGLDHLLQFLTMGGEERAAGAGAPRRLRDGITFENVSFTYPGASQPAVRQISLEIRPGERLALVGENGAGKSTLARLLLGLDAPTEGRICVDGIDLRDIDPAAWRARAAAVFQSFARYQLTARENVGFGDVRCLWDDTRITTAARQSGAHDVLRALPGGYDALLGKEYEGACDLSLGQWQKLALARAYLRDAEVLVLDEPAASLDALAEQEVYRQFSSMSDGKSMLLISHRLGSARLADRIVVLERGRVVEIGRHDELITHGGPYAEMYELQAEWYREPVGGNDGRIARGST
jgi:ATP-binding cassette, subfamily B, bacterial